jgi:hypothetical protein
MTEWVVCIDGYILLRHFTCLCHLCQRNSVSLHVARFHTEHFGRCMRLIEQEVESASSIFKKIDVEMVKNFVFNYGQH